MKCLGIWCLRVKYKEKINRIDIEWKEKPWLIHSLSIQGHGKKYKQKINSRKKDWNEVHHRIRKNCECEIERTGERVARETN